jgi:hypothetical protein
MPIENIYENHLIKEVSPYLLQHAHNPWTGIRGERKLSIRLRMRINQYSYPWDIIPVIGVM